MLRHLTTTQVRAIVAACEDVSREDRATYADSPNGIRANDPRLVDRMFNPPAAELRLVDLVDALTPDALVELVALMWTGRGDGTWAENLSTAADDRHPSVYVIEKSPALPDYLRDGLREIGMS